MQECSAGHRRARVLIGRVLWYGFADELRQATGCRLPDKRLAASGRPVQEKTLGLGKLELFECLRMQQRVLDGLSNAGNRLVLSPNLLPRDLGRGIKDMPVCLAISEFLKRHTMAGINANLI